MPQTGAAGSRRSDEHDAALPPAIVEFDPLGEIRAIDRRATAGRATARRAAASGGGRPVPHGVASPGGRPVPRGTAPPGGRTAARGARPPEGRVWADSRAAERAAVAEAFATRFGVDDAGPSAEALADRFGFRYEESPAGPAGRRTVTITGRGAERSVPPAERSVPRARRASHHGRDSTGRQGSWGLAADRAALWAVGLALLLAFVAATSAHATLPH